MISKWTLSLIFLAVIITLSGIQYLFISTLETDNTDPSVDTIVINETGSISIVTDNIVDTVVEDNTPTIAEIEDLKNRAYTSFDQGNYTESVELYEQLFQYLPHDTNTFKRPIIAYILRLKEPQKAVDFSSKIYNENQNDAMANNLYGWSLLANKEVDKSYEYLNRSTMLDPNMPEGYLNLGDYYATINDMNTAKQNFDKVIEINGEDGVISNIAKTLKDIYNIN